MRLFRFFSKVTFICNISFLLFLFFRWMELKKIANAASDRVIAVPFFKDLIIILGVSALIINLLMNIFYFIFLLAGKVNVVPLWLGVANFLFLILQIFYFFF
ncbi:MAG: hypothetical protein M3004_04840 [Bacteroidota bacterium]|nr:hypothetical protein [Bacteroidota bacterium]